MSLLNYFTKSPPKKKPKIEEPLKIEIESVEIPEQETKHEKSEEEVKQERMEMNRKKALELRRKREQEQIGLLKHLHETTWKEKLAPEFGKPYFLQLVKFLESEKKCGLPILPPEPLIFNALNSCPLQRVV